jgi:glycosyltransferase involved in cell wall biosynthesis
MRVAHIITRMIVGGAQENTLYNCLDLIRQYGDEVVLITGPTQGPEGRLLEQGRAEGLPVHLVDSLRRSIHPMNDLNAYRALKKFLRDFKPDVVHTHSAKGGMLGRAAARAVRVPAIIHSVHGAPFHPYQNAVSRSFFRNCERWAAGKCDHIISVADAMTELMVSNGVAPREKFTTVYSGMEVEPFLNANDHRVVMRRELGFKDDDVVVGKIARLFHLKGHEYIVQVASDIVARAPMVRFLFVGDGILREKMQAQIRQMGLEDRFVFTGLVPPEAIPKYFGAMDILVHTSLREGLARALPQGLLAGKPVISYDVDGAREVVLNERTGYLLPPKATQELADSIVKLAWDATLRQKMGELGRNLFTEQFRHEVMTSRIRKIYDEVLAEKRLSSSAK